MDDRRKVNSTGKGHTHKKPTSIHTHPSRKRSGRGGTGGRKETDRHVQYRLNEAHSHQQGTEEEIEGGYTEKEKKRNRHPSAAVRGTMERTWKRRKQKKERKRTAQPFHQ